MTSASLPSLSTSSSSARLTTDRTSPDLKPSILGRNPAADEWRKSRTSDQVPQTPTLLLTTGDQQQQLDSSEARAPNIHTPRSLPLEEEGESELSDYPLEHDEDDERSSIGGHSGDTGPALDHGDHFLSSPEVPLATLPEIKRKKFTKQNACLPAKRGRPLERGRSGGLTGTLPAARELRGAATRRREGPQGISKTSRGRIITENIPSSAGLPTPPLTSLDETSRDHHWHKSLDDSLRKAILSLQHDNPTPTTSTAQSPFATAISNRPVDQQNGLRVSPPRQFLSEVPQQNKVQLLLAPNMVVGQPFPWILLPIYLPASLPQPIRRRLRGMVNARGGKITTNAVNAKIIVNLPTSHIMSTGLATHMFTSTGQLIVAHTWLFRCVHTNAVARPQLGSLVFVNKEIEGEGQTNVDPYKTEDELQAIVGRRRSEHENEVVEPLLIAIGGSMHRQIAYPISKMIEEHGGVMVPANECEYYIVDKSEPDFEALRKMGCRSGTKLRTIRWIQRVLAGSPLQSKGKDGIASHLASPVIWTSGVSIVGSSASETSKNVQEGKRRSTPAPAVSSLHTTQRSSFVSEEPTAASAIIRSIETEHTGKPNTGTAVEPPPARPYSPETKAFLESLIYLPEPATSLAPRGSATSSTAGLDPLLTPFASTSTNQILASGPGQRRNHPAAVMGGFTPIFSWSPVQNSTKGDFIPSTFSTGLPERSRLGNLIHPTSYTAQLPRTTTRCASRETLLRNTTSNSEFPLGRGLAQLNETQLELLGYLDYCEASSATKLR